MRFVALIAGGFAGFAVDVSLFPLDTLKTRAQSQQGFFKAGGFKGVYQGLGPAALGSFPGGLFILIFIHVYLCSHSFVSLHQECFY